MIFPRFHQWAAARRMKADARATGAGRNYLVQHSAGSGKSNSIAWLAHRFSSLHNDDDQKVFDKVVVITDRVILDRQLQDTISQFEHAVGVVQRIDKDSTRWGQHLQNLLLNRLGSYTLPLIDWIFHRINGNNLARINVHPSAHPIHDTKDKTETFWHRFPVNTIEVTDEKQRGHITPTRWGGPT